MESNRFLFVFDLAQRTDSLMIFFLHRPIKPSTIFPMAMRCIKFQLRMEKNRHEIIENHRFQQVKENRPDELIVTKLIRINR